MTNFTVSVSNIRPPIPSGYNLDYSGFRLCGQYPGQPAAGRPAEVSCASEAIGRYVYVYVDEVNYLILCEVEVFGLREFYFNTICHIWI